MDQDASLIEMEKLADHLIPLAKEIEDGALLEKFLDCWTVLYQLNHPEILKRLDPSADLPYEKAKRTEQLEKYLDKIQKKAPQSAFPQTIRDFMAKHPLYFGRS